jgi:hypothetical protein
MAHRRAQENVHLVRELGRRNTEEFVGNWLLHSFGEAERDRRIEVVFADEERPSLRLEQSPASDGS